MLFFTRRAVMVCGYGRDLYLFAARQCYILHVSQITNLTVNQPANLASTTNTVLPLLLYLITHFASQR